MSFHLDSNTVIEITNQRRPAIRDRFYAERRAGTPMFISSIVFFELWYGISKGSRFQEDLATLRGFLALLNGVLPFAERHAAPAGEFRATLNAAGTPIGAYDLLIAAHAVREGATLVTANTREFSRVPGLVLEDWGAA